MNYTFNVKCYCGSRFKKLIFENHTVYSCSNVYCNEGVCFIDIKYKIFTIGRTNKQSNSMYGLVETYGFHTSKNKEKDLHLQIEEDVMIKLINLESMNKVKEFYNNYILFI